jgi:trehalose 6-phosphate phosphatase
MPRRLSRRSQSVAFERVAAMPLAATLLATDFDGTLAPIVADPPAAVGLPDSLRALARLAELGARVAVVSGRPRSFLETHVAIPGVRLLGDNGLEQPSATEARALHQFNSLASAAIAGRPGLTLVSTPGSSVVHFRAARVKAEGLFEQLASLAARLDLVASPGRMVVEVRPRRATKTRALESLIRELRPGCLVFAGDDEGDRDAFGLVSRFEGVHLALGIRSDETRPDLFDNCDLVFDDPAGFAAFLTEWISRVGED